MHPDEKAVIEGCIDLLDELDFDGIDEDDTCSTDEMRRQLGL